MHTRVAVDTIGSRFVDFIWRREIFERMPKTPGSFLSTFSTKRLYSSRSAATTWSG